MKQKNKNKSWVLWICLLAVMVILIFVYINWPSKYSRSQPTPYPCVAQSGYFCQSPILNSTTGNLSLQWGQNTGSNWNNTYIIFVSPGTSLNNFGIPMVSFLRPNATYIPFVQSGSVRTIVINVAKPYALQKNQQIYNATIWAQYTTSQNNTPQYAQIATINVRAS